jgi:peptidylprolyl isomerase
MKKILIGMLCVSIFVLMGCGGAKKAETETPEATKVTETKPAEDPHAGHAHATAEMTKAAGDTVTTDSGLKYIDIKVGVGATPKKGENVQVHYTGWLLENGKKFDSSKDRHQPFSFQLGMGRVIKGWDEGLSTMKVGGYRQLIIPPEMAYGKRSPSPAIPPDSWLVFDVELLNIPAPKQ